MVRSYQERPVPAEVLATVLDLATRAPSAGFSQGWDFLLLRAPADRELFWHITTDAASAPDRWLLGMRSAPVLIVCLADPQAYLDRYAEPDKGWTDRDPGRWPVPYWHVDTGMAALLMLLSGVDAGLGGCFFGVPGERVDALRAAFGIPSDRQPTGVISLGYPAEADRRSPSLRRGRRPLGEIVHDGRFGVTYRGPSQSGPPR